MLGGIPSHQSPVNRLFLFVCLLQVLSERRLSKIKQRPLVIGEVLDAVRSHICAGTGDWYWHGYAVLRPAFPAASRSRTALHYWVLHVLSLRLQLAGVENVRESEYRKFMAWTSKTFGPQEKGSASGKKEGKKGGKKGKKK